MVSQKCKTTEKMTAYKMERRIRKTSGINWMSRALEQETLEKSEEDIHLDYIAFIWEQVLRLLTRNKTSISPLLLSISATALRKSHCEKLHVYNDISFS